MKTSLVWRLGSLSLAAAFVTAGAGCNRQETPVTENTTASKDINAKGEKPTDTKETKKPAETKPGDAKAATAEVNNTADPAAAKKEAAKTEPAKPDVANADAAKPDAKKPEAGTPVTGAEKAASPAAGGAKATGGAGGDPEEKVKRTDPSFAARQDLDVEGQIRLILDMVNQPRTVRKTPDFVDHFLTVADALIASDASAAYKSSALLAKFKVLHEAAVDGNATAQEKLLKLAEAQRDNKGKRVAGYVRFVGMEQQLLAAAKADAATIAKLLDQLKTYLAGEEELSNRQLRMSLLSVDLIERLPEDQRDAWYKSLGELFAKSVDLDLAYVGQRFGKPTVKPSALMGKPFVLAGKLASKEDLKWENYKGKITVVDFWATWCPLCVDQYPKVKELFGKYRGRGFEVVGVSIDSNTEEVTKHLREYEIPWVTLIGKEPQEVAAKYGVRGVPTMFLIDAEGKILMRANTIAELEPAIKAEIEALEKKAAAKKAK